MKTILKNADHDRLLRPWNYYHFSNKRLCEMLDKLKGINPEAVPDLLEACKYTIEQLKDVKGKAFPITPILNAITKAEEIKS